MDSSRGCPIACCSKLLIIAVVLLVPVAAVVAFSPWSLPSVDAVSIASEDASGLNVVEPALDLNAASLQGSDESIERVARDWTFTRGPRPSSNR